MEVDSWVSVQARRERFEQLYEDSPLASSHSTPLHPVPRPRTSSIPNKNVQNSDEVWPTRKKNAQTNNNHEWDYKISKCAVGNSEQPTSGKIKKNSIKVEEKINHPVEKDEEPLESTATPLVGTAKKIPVFKPTSLATTTKNVREEGIGILKSDSQENRGRCFSHMRSRSHGNFIVKRDSSVEKNITGQENGVVGHRKIKSHKDWLTAKCKQRSIDNLLSSEDSVNSSSFEGKQRLVSNVVSNMKNKETPIVLRKLSFSKNEKDVKNMKEKSFLPNIRHKQPISDKTNRQKSNSTDLGTNIGHRLVTEEDTVRNKSHTSDIAIVPVLIAKAVAEVASRRCAVRKRSKTNSPSSLSSEDKFSDPPARPPRRRAAGPGPTPRRKGKAPSPPSQSSLDISNHSQEIYSEALNQISSSDESPDTTLHGFRDLTDDLKSCESISSCHSPEKCLKSLEMNVHMTSNPVSRLLSATNLKPECKSLKEQRRNSKCEILKTESQLVDLKNIKVNTVTETHHNNTEKLEEENITEVEGLPSGPPPKKPPRTFAYDIYKNSNVSSLDVEGSDASRTDKPEEKSSLPIYAVPVKKRNNKMVPKPPIRSKSDLSKEIIKPSVAPKPPHVLAKAKRASLVDPFSSLDKGEEASVTSEFQRQAHIRYSLRKPNKAPPTPCDRNGNAQNNSHSEVINSSLEIHHDPEYSIIESENEKKNSTNYRCRRDTSFMTNTSSGSAKIKSQPVNTSYTPKKEYCQSEYEDIATMTSSRSPVVNEQPLSLTYCLASNSLPDAPHLQTKRSMSDETLYKGCRQEEPVYAVPTLKNNNQQRNHTCQKELHYLCSVLFTDEEEADAGRDGTDYKRRRNSIQGREKEVSGTEAEDGSKGRSSLISAWKREFRQSCRQVQSRIKKTVIR